MALFNQDEGDEEVVERNLPDFSGSEPVVPDGENETPSPVAADGTQESQEPVPVDSANDYASSPEEEQPVEGKFVPAGEGESGYAQAPAEQPSGGDDYKPIAPPGKVSLNPFADHSADYAAMQDLKEAESKENVKPSIGRKILAAVVRAGTGFEHGPKEGIEAGQATLNRPLANAQQRWARAEAPIQERITNDQAQDTAIRNQNSTAEQQGRLNETNYRNQSLEQQNNARARKYAADAEAKNEGINGDGWKPDDPKNPLGGYSGVSIGGKPIHSAEPPKSVQLTSGYRRAAGSAMGLTGHELTRYALTGTMPAEKAPRQASAEDMQWGAYLRSLGHPPTTQDVINFKRGTPGDNDPETIIAKNMQAKDAFENQWRRVGKDEATSSTPEGSYVSTDGTGRMMPGPEFNSRVEKFRTDLNASTPMRKSGTQVDSTGTTISAGPTQQQPPQQQQVKHYQGKAYTKDVKTGQWVLQQAGGGSGPPNPR